MTGIRNWGGQTASERQLERRHRLIAAAIQLYGRDGYRNTGVRPVCQAAGLTERYFYESFANGEALLEAAYDVARATHVEAILAADVPDLPPVCRAKRLLAAYFARLQSYPAETRLFLLEITNISPAMDLAFEQSQATLSELILEIFDPDRVGPLATQPLLRRGVTGGLLSIAVAWSSAGFDRPLDEVVAAALPLCQLAAPATNSD